MNTRNKKCIHLKSIFSSGKQHGTKKPPLSHLLDLLHDGPLQLPERSRQGAHMHTFRLQEVSTQS